MRETVTFDGPLHPCSAVSIPLLFSVRREERATSSRYANGEPSPLQETRAGILALEKETERLRGEILGETREGAVGNGRL